MSKTGRANRNAESDVYRPAEVAKRLKCSEWWIKEQARRGLIPYAWIGGGYRFTEEHVAEIIRFCERRPLHEDTQRTAPTTARRSAVTSPQPVTRLTPRTPRRARAVRQQPPEAA